MYRKEYTETIFRTGSHTSRKSSVKQHEMAALREMEQMILAAEAVPCRSKRLWKEPRHIWNNFCSRCGRNAFWTKNSVRWKRSGSSLKTATHGGTVFCGMWHGSVIGKPDRTGERNRLERTHS